MKSPVSKKWFLLLVPLLWLTCGRQASQMAEAPPSPDTLQAPTGSVPPPLPVDSAAPQFAKAPPTIRYRDYVYRSTIKTVLWHVTGEPLSDPLIELHNSKTLTLRFDDLDADIKDYSYTVTLCDADWTPADLPQLEYIKGFTRGHVDRYAFSGKSQMPYTHYTLEFPNAEMQVARSGNYLLKIFTGNDPAEMVLTRRFYVLDTKVEVEATVRRPALAKFYNTHQEIDFAIDHEDLVINNPFQEIQVAIVQNNRWDHAITDLKPRFVRNALIQYDYQGKVVFPGGKEFRYFDIRSVRYAKAGVEQVERNGAVQAWLQADETRSFMQYIYFKDYNGKFWIEVEDEHRPHLDAEYAQVHFHLPMAAPFVGGQLHVLGAFTGWDTRPDNRLRYDFDTRAYQGSLLLKQGYYTYQYMQAEKGASPFSTAEVEGDSYETENNYAIYVYFRPVGQRYDQLIAVKKINSRYDEP